MDKFEAFKIREKFVEDPSRFYTGVADLELRSRLSDALNNVAEDFKNISGEGNPSDKAYLDTMKATLDPLEELFLDTEDREAVCGYFEELMSMVGLKSSQGILNMFLYGFNPNDL